MSVISDYIRQAAIERGINPDIAVRVAQSEGGLTNPTQQSYVVKNGVRETSYGPFQLRIGGGIGDFALKAGIDPRKTEDWKKGVDYALNYAVKNGWGSWYGAAKLGITGKTGIGKNAAPVAVSTAAAARLRPMATADIRAMAPAPTNPNLNPKVTGIINQFRNLTYDGLKNINFNGQTYNLQPMISKELFGKLHDGTATWNDLPILMKGAFAAVDPTAQKNFGGYMDLVKHPESSAAVTLAGATADAGGGPPNPRQRPSLLASDPQAQTLRDRAGAINFKDSLSAPARTVDQFGRPVLSDSGAHPGWTEHLQSHLAQAFPWKADELQGGQYAAATKGAVMALQQIAKQNDPKVMVDGVVGPQTWGIVDRLSSPGMGQGGDSNSFGPYLNRLGTPPQAAPPPAPPAKPSLNGPPMPRLRPGDISMPTDPNSLMAAVAGGGIGPGVARPSLNGGGMPSTGMTGPRDRGVAGVIDPAVSAIRQGITNPGPSEMPRPSLNGSGMPATGMVSRPTPVTPASVAPVVQATQQAALQHQQQSASSYGGGGSHSTPDGSGGFAGLLDPNNPFASLAAGAPAGGF